MAALIRRTVRFRGRVQGVGFRMTTREIAGRFAVIGFVQNLPDGRVLLVAEGDVAELNGLIAAVQSEMSRFIAGTEFEDGVATGEFDEFEIRS